MPRGKKELTEQIIPKLQEMLERGTVVVSSGRLVRRVPRPPNCQS